MLNFVNSKSFRFFGVLFGIFDDETHVILWLQTRMIMHIDRSDAENWALYRERVVLEV